MVADKEKRKMRVFIADDSDLLRERLIGLITEIPGVMISGQADNVGDAISAIQIEKPEVIILDIRMPGGSGIDVLKTVKSDLPASVVIVLTNYSYSQYRKICLNAGADYFFEKTSEFDRIPAILNELRLPIAES